MKKELGKWLMDIAKYVTTAIILGSFLGGLKELWLLYLAGAIVTLITLTSGLLLIRLDKYEEKQKEK